MRIIEETGDIPKMPVVFPGFLFITFECPECDLEWHGLTPVGGPKGAECPSCGFTIDTEWVPKERSPQGHDGAWLTGEWDLPDWMSYDVGDDEADADYDMRAAPLWMRIYAFVNLVKEACKELFGRRSE